MRLTATLSLPQQPSSIARARHVLETLLSLTDASDDRRAELTLLITEACANAVRHAEPHTPIELAIAISDRQCVLEVRNCADHFAPAEVPSVPPEPHATSGRGLPVITALADDTTFVPTQPGHVLLRITKRLT
jgi:anti-sigma regulatory factor (Ser/Thr protein kinase)